MTQGMAVDTCNSSYSGRRGKRIAVQAQPGIILRPYLKNKQARTVVQVVESLPSKCEAQNSKPSTAKKKKKKVPSHLLR
jgi:hypothetical protein